ncbi:M15 family metallopeptidase [Oceanobacillus caeni]|uniref:M15 family metallopeptidase n=1 Tax=Oceanobacillus caeni TaxID=405946 RepID=UPI001C238382|nr:M15 family metallopeptidase [Oceanobacillus caeni]MBU8791483.1 M15 family metallopeptidase [Oceanobacillus caeni]
MKRLRNILLSWIMVTPVLITLMIAYNNKMDERYIDLGDDAPISSELHPVVEKNKNILLEQADAINIDVVITVGTRSIDEQNELYAQGRTTSGNIVTNARGGESYHNYGLAIDYAIRQENGVITWDTQYDGNNNRKSDWLEVADLAKDLGFEWGGDWGNFPDYAHLQMDFGHSINQLQNGKRPAYDKNTEEGA